MNAILETERLQLRTFTLDDTQFIMELLNSAGWLRFIGDKNVRTEEQARSYLENGPLKSYGNMALVYGWQQRKTIKPLLVCAGSLKEKFWKHLISGLHFCPNFTERVMHWKQHVQHCRMQQTV